MNSNRKPPNAGKGRPKGALNKSTRVVREALATIAEDNVDELRQWLKDAAAKDPAKGFELYLRMIEYHIPKLGRTELTGDKNNPVEPFKVQLVRYTPEEINKRFREMIDDETAP